MQQRSSGTRTCARLHDAGILRVTCGEDLKKQAYGEALTAARHGLILLADMPGNDHLRQVLQRQADLAERGQTVQELHALADQIRYLYGAEQLPAATVEELAGRCREEWGERRRLLEPAGLDLGAWIEKRLQTDLLNLGLIWADLQVRLAPAKKHAQAQDHALGVLAEVESLFGPNPVLYRERQVLLEGLGRKQEARAAAAQAATCEPKSGWEHYALGRYSYRSGSFKDAAASFERAIDLHPRDFWPHFYAGICAYRLQRYDQAVSAFDVAVALAEQSPECWFNRGLANAALGRQVRTAMISSALSSSIPNWPPPPWAWAPSITRRSVTPRPSPVSKSLLPMEPTPPRSTTIWLSFTAPKRSPQGLAPSQAGLAA